jgi:hypothetical protein
MNIIAFPQAKTDPKPAPKKRSGWQLELRPGPPPPPVFECIVCMDVRDDEAPFHVALFRTGESSADLTSDWLFPICEFCADGKSRTSILRRARECLAATMWCRDPEREKEGSQEGRNG